MGSDKSLMKRGTYFDLIGIGFLLIFLCLFSNTPPGFTQEIKEGGKVPEDRFSDLIENGARMIREYEFGTVLRRIEALTPDKRGDFRVRVLENFASLKGYLVVKEKQLGRKWKADYKAMVYTGNKTATHILIDLLKDRDQHMRASTAGALGYLGDQTALEGLKRVADQDKNSKVRSKAKWAYEHISGGKFPEEPSKED